MASSDKNCNIAIAAVLDRNKIARLQIAERQPNRIFISLEQRVEITAETGDSKRCNFKLLGSELDLKSLAIAASKSEDRCSAVETIEMSHQV